MRQRQGEVGFIFAVTRRLRSESWQFILFFALSLIGSDLHAEDAPQFRGVRGDGHFNGGNWTHLWGDSGPRVQWQYALGTGFSSVVGHDGKVVSSGHAEGKVSVVALDLETGRQLWRYQYDAPLDANDFQGGPTSTPLIDDGCVYVLSRRGELFSLNLADGNLNWRLDVVDRTAIRIPGWGFAGAPRVFGNRLVLNVGDAGVCVHKRDGEILWASEDRDSGYSSVVPYQDRGVDCVILGSGRSYVCVELETGRERWRQRWLTTFGCNAADAIVDGDRVFLSSGYSRGSALLDLSSGDPEVIWKHKDYRNQLGTSILIDGFLYGVNGDVDEGARLTCMEMSTGKIRWDADGFSAGAVIASGERLIALSDSGELIVAKVDPEGFIPLARHQVLQGRCWVSPTLIEGMLLCRNADGKLLCLNLRR